MKKYYYTADHEAGNIIDRFESIEEARAAIAKYVEEDKRDGTYEPGFYEICNEDRETIEVEGE